jgi:hypothetical protein
MTVSASMTPAPTMFRLDDDVREGMETLKDRDGIPFNTQANKALREWLERKGVLKTKPAKK